MKYLFQEHSPTFHHDSGINRHCQKDDDSDKNADTTTAKMLTEKLRECTHIHLGTHFLRAQSEKDKGDNHTYEHIEHAKPLNTHTKSILYISPSAQSVLLCLCFCKMLAFNDLRTHFGICRAPGNSTRNAA